MLWRVPKHPSHRPLPKGFILPAQPTLVTKPVTAPGWLHEIKHDGYRMVARRFPDGRVALWSRNAVAWTERLPLIRAALLSLPVASVTLDGEAIAPHPDGTSTTADSVPNPLFQSHRRAKWPEKKGRAETRPR